MSDCLESASGSLEIPSTYNGLPVTSIGNYAFDACTGLNSITIPDSVTSIGAGAFHNCTSLTSLAIPDSVTSIANYTFENCTALTSLTIPDSVTSISEFAMINCSSLTSINVSNSNAYYTVNNGVLYNKAEDTLIAYPAVKSG